MAEQEINNCKNCGAESIITTDTPGMHWIIQCTKCPSRMEGRREDNPRYLHFDQHDALIRAWNRNYG